MKNKLLQFLIIVCISSTNASAQDYFSFYNLGDYVIQSQNISPVYLPKNTYTFAIPAVNLGLNFNSGFKINDLLIQDELTKKLEFSLENLYENTSNINDLNTDISINLFYVGYKRKNGSISFFVNTKVTNNWRYTKDFLGILANGINESFILNDANNYTGYNEIGIGFTQTFLESKLAIAIRAKFLNGSVHTSTKENSQIAVKIDETSGAYTISSFNSTINSSGSIFFNQNQKEEFKIFTPNKGWGLDFGATYSFTDKFSCEIAVNDLGYIYWHKDVKNFNIEDTPAEGSVVSGIDFNSTTTNLRTILFKQLISITEANVTEDKFSSKLSMKSYASLKYAVTPKNSFSFITFNTHAFDDFKPSFSLGYNRTLNKSNYGMLISKAGINNELLFGVNFALNLGPLQLYAATDSLKAIFKNPEESMGLNARIGLNLLFDFQKPVEVENE